jgi:hypothetical protein
VLGALVRADGAWLRCVACDDAFWGAANVTAVVVAKAERHARKAHGAAAGGRPQRRAAAAGPQVDMGAEALVALATALAKVGTSNLPLKRLGAGVARTGYSLVSQKLVIKFAHRGQESHNLAEARTYAEAPADKRAYLCPVLAVAPDGAWLIMRHASIGAVKPADRQALERAIGNHIADLHGGNIGYVDGHVVATDYAGGWRARAVNWGR